MRSLRARRGANDRFAGTMLTYHRKRLNPGEGCCTPLDTPLLRRSAPVSLCWWPVEEDAYSPVEASRVLGVSDRRVRQLLESGELEGGQDASGRWRAPRRAVHAMLEERGSPRSPGKRTGTTAGSSAGEGAEASPGPLSPRSPRDRDEDLRELVSRVEDLSYRLGASQARLELSERAESSVREERDRLLRELEAERAERRRLAERLERLQGAAKPGDDLAGQEEQPARNAGIPSEAAPTPQEGRGSEGPERAPWWKRIFR